MAIAESTTRKVAEVRMRITDRQMYYVLNGITLVDGLSNRTLNTWTIET